MAEQTRRSSTGQRYSIRIQFTLIFFFLMLGAIGACWIINNTFLERYYIREKRIALTQIYYAVNEAVNNNSIDSDEFDEEVMKIAGKENVNLIVMDEGSTTIKLHTSDSSLIFWPSCAISVRLFPLYLALKSSFFILSEISVSSRIGCVSFPARKSAKSAPTREIAMPMYPMNLLAILELLWILSRKVLRRQKLPSSRTP